MRLQRAIWSMLTSIVDLAELPGRLVQMKHEIDVLRTRVDTLEFMRGPNDVPLTIDPAVQWMEDHPDEVRSHAGKRIAVHPRLGIVAAHADLAKLIDMVNGLGLSDEVVMDYIPRSA